MEELEAKAERVTEPLKVVDLLETDEACASCENLRAERDAIRESLERRQDQESGIYKSGFGEMYIWSIFGQSLPKSNKIN